MNFNRTSVLLITALTALQTVNAGSRVRSKQPKDQANVTTTSPTGPYAFAVSTNGDFTNPISQLGIIDLAKGLFRPISTLSGAPVGIARDRQGHLYSVDYNNNFVEINPATGQLTTIGPTGLSQPGPLGAAVDVITSLTNGELFLLDYNNVLYRVDPTTGGAEMIGSTGITPITTPFFGTSFSGDCDTLFFTVEEDDENGNALIPATLYRIDPRTAAATKIGKTASFMGGSGFIGGSLYGFKIDENLIGGGPGPEVLQIGLAAGAAKMVSNLNVPSIFGAVSLGEDNRGCRAGR